jgi:hypothetical protein
VFSAALRLRVRAAVDQAIELDRDLRRRQHELDRPDLRGRRRHVREPAGAVVLRDHRATSVSDREAAERGIGAAAREHDADRAIAIGPGHRREHQVRVRSNEPQPRPIDQADAVLAGHVHAGWADIDGARLEQRAVLGVTHPQPRAPRQDLDEHLGLRGPAVLDQGDGSGKVRRQRREHIDDRRQRAGGGGDHHQPRARRTHTITPSLIGSAAHEQA